MEKTAIFEVLVLPGIESSLLKIDWTPRDTVEKAAENN